MRTRIDTLAKTLAFIALVALLTAGCGRAVRRTRIVHPHGAQIVVITKGHAHSVRCGHYRHGGKWYLVKSHTHRARCGHAKVKGVWVIR